MLNGRLSEVAMLNGRYGVVKGGSTLLHTKTSQKTSKQPHFLVQ
jgi:hypothetical protein